LEVRKTLEDECVGAGDVDEEVCDGEGLVFDFAAATLVDFVELAVFLDRY